jgi:DNA-directed RNA polymerase I, II, and III subunit RPABC2
MSYLSATNINSEEPQVDFDEEAEPDLLDDEDDQPGGGGEDPDNAEAGDDNVVVSGDANAAAQAKEGTKNTVTSEKDKRVKNENRTTTPYMTKYEKARVLGTRALQIRWVAAGS